MEGFVLEAARVARERARGLWPGRVATDYLDRWAAEKPQASALVAWRMDEEREARLSWAELARRVARIANTLRHKGAGPGDVVSFQLPSGWEFIATYLATVRIGAIANPLMPIFRHRELSFMLRQADARVFIAPVGFRGFDHAALARQLAGELPGMRLLLAGGEGAESLEAERGAAGADFERGARLLPDEVTQLLYTSGTTGESKGVLHTSNTLLCAVHAFAGRMGLGGDDVIFMPSPLAHQLGFCYGMLLSLVLGVPLVTTDIWRPARAAQLIEANGATFTFAATPFLADLADHARRSGRRVGRLRLFASSGAPIPPAVAQAAREHLGVAVAASWGMTECASVTVTPPEGGMADESDGCALPNGEVRIVDGTGREAVRGEIGPLQVRGASLFAGYLKRPHLYRLDDDGWFDTGDLARMDQAGYIRICGRSKDVIIRGGENIPVVEVEAALYRMPEVVDAAVVAMPDPRLQERACAFVSLRAGRKLDLAAVCKHLAGEGFSKHFWPERLEVVAEMPRTPTGKIQKFVLREIARTAQPQADAAPRAA
jgi:cyclohexanecarboxylate-CoA ligase